MTSYQLIRQDNHDLLRVIRSKKRILIIGLSILIALMMIGIGIKLAGFFLPGDFSYQKMILQHGYQKLSKKKNLPMQFEIYTVKKDDSLWNIAKKTGLSIDTIIACNKLKHAHLLSIGTELQLPIIDGILYRKRLEEDASEIASKYTISKKKLEFFNPDMKTNRVVFIPGVSFSLDERLKRLGHMFFRPIAANRISSRWGMRIHPISRKREFHAGIDLAAPIGAPIYSAKGGTVISSGYSIGYGRMVVISHGDNYKTRYAHLSKIRVKVGQRVASGQVIGNCGSSGRSTGPHLHFEVIRKGKPINPLGVTELY